MFRWRDRIAGLLACLLVLMGQAYSAGCPAIPKVPELTEEEQKFLENWTHLAPPHRAYDSAEELGRIPFGIGYLRLHDRSEHLYDWPKDAVVPLWQEPREEAFLGWIRAGRVQFEGRKPSPLTGAGMVETAYEQNRFVVYRRWGDWFAIRPLPGAGGLVWTHPCRLGLGSVKLVFEEWEDLIREHGDWLHFREAIPHWLRAGPGTHYEKVAQIGLDHKLVLLEMRGDWMKVQVEEPDLTCRGAARKNPPESTHQGWVQWRDESKGPWVWFYSRGC